MKSLPVLLAASISLATTACSGEDTAQAGSKPSSESVSSASIDDLSGMSQQLMQDVNKILSGIKDVDDVKGAKAKLEELSEHSAELGKRWQELKGSEALDPMKFTENFMSMQSEMVALSEHFAHIETIPGAVDELEAPMTKITSFLSNP